jgi:hypothetical protein
MSRSERSGENPRAKKNAPRTAAKRAAKKKEGRSDKTARKTSLENESVAPADPAEVARLAAQLLSLKEPGIKGTMLSDSIHDNAFRDAVHRAKSLLDLAAGRSEEQVYAYQLFNEQEKPMTFEEVSERFGEANWRGFSPNVVKDWVKNLVRETSNKIDAEINRHNFLIAESVGYPFDQDLVEADLRDAFSLVLSDTQFSSLLEDKRDTVQELVRKFFEHVDHNRSDLGGRHSIDTMETLQKYRAFLPAVLDGLSPAKFLGEPEHALTTSFHDTDCVLFLLNGIGNSTLSVSKEDAREYGGLLGRFSTLDSVSPETSRNLKICASALIVGGYEAKEKRKLFLDAAASLTPLRDYRWFNMFWRFMRWDEIRVFSEQSVPNPATNTFAKDLRKLTSLLKKADRLQKRMDVHADKATYVGLFNSIKLLCDSLHKALPAANIPGGQKVIKKLEHIAQASARAVKSQQPDRNRRKHLERLVDALTPHSGTFRFRPYELFLFAAEENLMVDKLTTRRNKLNADFQPFPRKDLNLNSILWSHRYGDEDTEF